MRNESSERIAIKTHLICYRHQTAHNQQLLNYRTGFSDFLCAYVSMCIYIMRLEFLLQNDKFQINFRNAPARVWYFKRFTLAGVGIAVAKVPVNQLMTKGDHGHENAGALLFPRFFLGRLEQFFSNAFSLQVRLNGKHTEIKLITLSIEFDAAQN